MSDFQKMDWAERLQALMRNPNLVDRMGSADLKRACKSLCQVLMVSGERAARAEIDHDRLLARLLELTGGEPPGWSYIYKEEVYRLHEFVSFATVKTDTGWSTCGEEDGKLHPVYDFDTEEFGAEEAELRSQNMLVHLRQCFNPRNPEVTP